MREMANKIYNEIFKLLNEKCNDIQEERGINIRDDIPHIYNYFDKIEGYNIVDKYTLQLENNVEMSFFIDIVGNVFNDENKKIGTYNYQNNIITLSD